jgi:hypothetical protein
MMTVQHQAQFPLEALRPMLESMGWDVSLRETLEASCDDAEGAFRLVIDRGGNAYLRRTSLASKPRGKIVQRAGQTYAVHSETTITKSVATTLNSVDAFGSTFSEMQSLARITPEDRS